MPDILELGQPGKLFFEAAFAFCPDSPAPAPHCLLLPQHSGLIPPVQYFSGYWLASPSLATSSLWYVIAFGADLP